MSEKGRFYVFEGIDGSGKSTCAKAVYDFLLQKGIEAVLTEEPNEKFGIRKIIKEHLICKGVKVNDGIVDLLGYALDRRFHALSLVEPSLAAGKVVISDRYYHSFVYQIRSGVQLDYSRAVNSFARKPDITIIFDVDAETGQKRLGRRNGVKDKFENLEFLRGVAELYRNLDFLFLRTERIEVVDANKSEEEVKQQVIKIISEDLNI